MLESARSATVFESLSSEALGVVARRELIAVADVPIALSQVNILVEGAVVIIDSRIQIVDRRNLIRSDWRGQRYQNGIAGNVALTVVVEEEEEFILLHGSTKVAAKLIEVIAGLQRKGPPSALRKRALQAVDGIIGI